MTPWKTYLVTQVHDIMGRWYADQPADERGPIGAYCLWWAYFTCLVLRRHGIRAQLQAGSAYWPRITREQDDGVSPDRFGYEYMPGRQAFGDTLPEIHVWAAVMETQTFIDVTTPFWPEQASITCQMDWPGIRPPDYLWCQSQKFPDRVIYHANMEAIHLCYKFIKDTRDQLRCEVLFTPPT